MTRNNIYIILAAVLMVAGSIDISLPVSNAVSSPSHVCVGVNGKQVQQGVNVAKKGWSFLKSCGCKRPKPISPVPIPIPPIELLGKGIEEAKASDDVLKKIGEYLSQTKPNEGGKLVIRCIKSDANQVRVALYDYGKSTPKVVNELRTGTEEVINLAEYNINAMQENIYMGADGIEYVSFIIPKHPQYILNGSFSDRIYECMIFNIPKDTEGRWVRFKEYLYAFINDVLNRPGQLWDEYVFRRGLIEMNINSRDVNEIKQYMFAQVNYNKNDGILEKVA